jgi:glutamyl-tRNA synthetase
VSEVRVRFAPSPTGFLHLGGVRTALFNWLFARNAQGRFILRIDDTDSLRNDDSALRPILKGLKWLGLLWDEGPEIGGPHAPYFQSRRAARYQEAVELLIARDKAYYDYASADEIAAERAGVDGPFQYSRSWMARSPEQRENFQREGRTGVVRLLMPRTGILRIEDIIRGTVTFEWKQEADHVIQRSDGTVLYSLANVVDDHDFGITHVVRAEEHLSNTPRQVFIAEALGYQPPAYAHLPYVAEPDSRRKLSKRKLSQYLTNPRFSAVHEHGIQIAEAMGINLTEATFNPVVLDFYETVGYLPETLINYLALLGWSLDGKTEIICRADLVKSFSLERVSSSPASFDPAKLESFQRHYMRVLPVEDKTRMILPFLEKAGLIRSPLEDNEVDRIKKIIVALGDRLVVLGDILLQGRFFFGDDVSYDPKAMGKWIGDYESIRVLQSFRDWLLRQDSFSSDALERATGLFLADAGIRLRNIVHAVRFAITGTTAGPSIFDCLSLIGKERCIHRMNAALTLAESRKYDGA